MYSSGLQRRRTVATRVTHGAPSQTGRHVRLIERRALVAALLAVVAAAQGARNVPVTSATLQQAVLGDGVRGPTSAGDARVYVTGGSN